MIDSLSPYALLKRSKPKPTSFVTEYDLYSAAQPQQDANSFPAFPAAASVPAPVSSAASSEQEGHPPAYTQHKTHYISAIKQRHSHASRRAQMIDARLPSHSSPSSNQTPPT